VLLFYILFIVIINYYILFMFVWVNYSHIFNFNFSNFCALCNNQQCQHYHYYIICIVIAL